MPLHLWSQMILWSLTHERHDGLHVCSMLAKNFCKQVQRRLLLWNDVNRSENMTDFGVACYCKWGFSGSVIEIICQTTEIFISKKKFSLRICINYTYWTWLFITTQDYHLLSHTTRTFYLWVTELRLKIDSKRQNVEKVSVILPENCWEAIAEEIFFQISFVQDI